MQISEKRSEMPVGTNAVLDRRTIYNSNKNLLSLIKEGDTILDVGCGSGSITRGMAELTGNSGKITGIDTSQHLIDLAKQYYGDCTNLVFSVGNINSYTPDEGFDIINSSRVLQWLNNPEEVLIKMKTLLNPDGCISILDYNHIRIEFEPALPDSMQLFYNAFLKWKQDSGMDLEIADHLPEIFEKIGLKNITVEDQSEYSQKGTPEFMEEISIWRKVAETRGVQMVADNYISEDQRIKAIDEYSNWMEKEAKSMKLYLLAVTGYNDADSE